MTGKKYLDVRQEAGKSQKDSIMENKMQPGTRRDQSEALQDSDPQDKISGSKGVARGTPAGNTANEQGAIHALARELRISLKDVTGTGEDGRITEDDVRKAADARDKKPKGERGTTKEHITEVDVRKEKDIIDQRDAHLQTAQTEARQGKRP